MRSYYNKENVECFTTAHVFHDRSLLQQVIAASSVLVCKKHNGGYSGKLDTGGGRIDISCSVVLDVMHRWLIQLSLPFLSYDLQYGFT